MVVGASMQVTFVMGATASGKSHWALNFARQNQGVCIMNADSVQQYKGLYIGSAAPSPAEMAEVPHFLFHWVEKGQEVSLGDYFRQARKQLELLSQQGMKEVLVVGGTNFYFRALEKGLFPIPAKNEDVQKKWQQLLDSRGAEHLHELLSEKDPQAAQRIHVRDHYRLIRALEILEVTGQTLTDLETAQKTQAFPYPLKKLVISCERDEIHRRIQDRTQKMFERGWRKEVEDLVEEGLSDWAPLKSVGYREVLAWVRGEITEEVCIAQVNQSTRQLVRKQETWLRKEPGTLQVLLEERD